MDAKLFDDYENEKRLLALMQNKQEFEKYLLEKHNSSLCNVPFEPFIWAVHFNIPRNNRFSTLEYIFQQSFSHMKTSYSFLPDKQVIGITYTALGIPTVCGEPDKCFLKAHKKFKMYYPTKKPSKRRKPPVAISKNKYFKNKKRNTTKKTTNGSKKGSNLLRQAIENESNSGFEALWKPVEEQTPPIDTLSRPNNHEDRQQLNDSTSPEQSPLIFISRDPKSVDNGSRDHEMVTPKLERHRPSPKGNGIDLLDQSVCSVETVKLTSSQTTEKIETQNNDTLSELCLEDSEPSSHFQGSVDENICITTDTNNSKTTSGQAVELTPQSSDNVLSSEEILANDFKRFISSDDMANDVDDIVLGSSTTSSSSLVMHPLESNLGGSPTDSSLEMIIVKSEHHQPSAVPEADDKSETSTLNTSSSLNLQHQRPNHQSYMDFSDYSASDSWLEMKINFSNMSFSDSVGSTAPKMVTTEDQQETDGFINKFDDSWENIKNDIKWGLGFESENPITSWTSSSDFPKQSWTDNNGGNSRLYNNSFGSSLQSSTWRRPSSSAASDSEGLDRINRDFMSWSSTSGGGRNNIVNTSPNTRTNALFQNFSFEDSLYLQLNTSNSSTNNESSSLVGIVKMAENIKKTIGS